jgi:hypothetical protein
MVVWNCRRSGRREDAKMHRYGKDSRVIHPENISNMPTLSNRSLHGAMRVGIFCTLELQLHEV